MLSPDFRDQVVRFVSGNITLDALEDWFLPQVFDLIVDPYSDDASLAGAIELCLAEMQDGIRSESATRQYLLQVLDELGVRVLPAMILYRYDCAATYVTTTASYTGDVPADLVFRLQPEPVYS